MPQGKKSRVQSFSWASFPSPDSIPWSEALQDRSVISSLVVDLALVAVFTIQHSLLAWSRVKQALQSVLGVLTRTAYCFTTALALQVKGPPGLSEDAFIIPNTFPPLLFSVSLYQILMHFWQPVTGAPCLWSVRHAPWSIWLPLLCFSLHFLCWAIICSILMLFDYPELLGIKQVNWLRCVNT